ncbi:MAG: hypothetical protein AAB853_00750 [Patescibacteria group bacterium]|jgi:hypothetical protein
MSGLFETPGMTMLLTTLLVAQCLSLCYMAALYYEFRHIHRKRVDILTALGSDRARTETAQARVLGTIYVTLTLLSVAFTSFLFLWQPHIL